MSSHDSFSDIDSTKTPDRPEHIEEDHEDCICSSCSFDLEKHSIKQIIGCALKEIHLVLGGETK